jgi:hypothetical protein
MATGRTLQRFTRFYMDGYDLSGFGRAVGPLEVAFDEVNMTTWTDAVLGYLSNHPQVNVGTLSAIFDNTATTGLHTVAIGQGVQRTITVALGMRAAPVDGDPAFCGQFIQGAYQSTNDGGAIAVNLPFSGWSASATSRLYDNPWGMLLHANAARTSAQGVNTAVGFDNPTDGPTTKGGFFAYHVLAGTGTVTLSVDDSDVNTDGNFTPLIGATSGSINCALKPSGIVALANNAEIQQFTRYQVAFGTSTSVTFVSSLIRIF